MNLFLGVFPSTCYGHFHLPVSLKRRVIFPQGLMQPLSVVPLDENIIDHAAFSVHADPDLFLFENRREFFARKLGALVGIEIFRPSFPLSSKRHPSHFPATAFSTG
jgi:hypothetical protein